MSLTTLTSLTGELVRKTFQEKYGSTPLVVQSPGRINLIGEHTDYNGGFVMPAAIDKGIWFAIAKSSDEESEIFSIKYDSTFPLNLDQIRKSQDVAWANYILGILARLKALGYHPGSFRCVFDGDLPTGAGMSSSAALECGFVFALNELFQFNLSKHEMIHIAQWAEHNYVGVKCGIMDQFTSMMGKMNHVLLLDCRSLEHHYFPFKLNGYQILICDSGVKHSLASSEYNTRRKECEEGVEIIKQSYPQVESLRDMTVGMVNMFKDRLRPTVYNRCLYVIQENERVILGSKDLQDGNLRAFGAKMYQTHAGLSALYEVSCSELDFMVNFTKQKNVLGARMMGGGFGGCTINITRDEETATFIEELSNSYYSKFGIELKTYRVKLSDGTSIRY